jgi:hypothetical protein
MRRLVAVAGLAIGMAGLMAPSANAGVLVKSAPSCAPQPLVQPFASLGDNSNYTRLPGGDFDNGAPGWSLSKAAVVSKALQISPGGVATSPTICAGLDHPTMRFYSKSSGLLPVGSVSVLAETSLGLVVEVPLGLMSPGSSLHATPKYLVIANLLPLLPNDYTPLAFRFRAVTGTWTIDDVYVDPRMR